MMTAVKPIDVTISPMNNALFTQDIEFMVLKNIDFECEFSSSAFIIQILYYRLDPKSGRSIILRSSIAHNRNPSTSTNRGT